MTTYEKLDVVADLYSPLLIVILLVCLGYALYRKNWLELGLLLYGTIFGMAVVYGLMFLDKGLNIWGSLGLDYSTHTAFALCLVFVVAVVSRRFIKTLPASLVLYCLLMLYQQYHTLADIVTTAVVITLLLSILLYVRKQLLVKLWGVNGIERGA